MLNAVYFSPFGQYFQLFGVHFSPIVGHVFSYKDLDNVERVRGDLSKPLDINI